MLSPLPQDACVDQHHDRVTWADFVRAIALLVVVPFAGAALAISAVMS